MFTSRVEMRLLADRLDAEHFEPGLLRSERMVLECGLPASSLDDVRHSEAGITYGIVQPGDFVPAGQGVRMIRCTDLGGLSVDVANVLWVDREIDRPYGRSRVQPGDVLVGIAGSVGTVGIAPADIEPANLNQSVARIRCRSLVLGGWTAAYLASRYGQDVLARRSVGAVQQHLNLADLPSVPIPEPADGVLSYVAAKVREAEALRARARELSAEMVAAFRNIHRYSPDRRLGSWRQVARTLHEERLDATFYTPPAVQLVDALRSDGAPEVAQVSVLVKDGGFDPAKPISYFEIGGLDISTGCAWPTVVPPGEAPSRAQRVVRHWDILVGTVRPERKNVGIVPPSATGQLVATSGVAVLRAGTPERAAYLWGFLRSDAATEQLMRWNTGAAYPAIDDDVPPRVLMPPVTDDEITRLGARWMRIPMLHACAKALVAAARVLVEALIERKVSEAELMTASKDPHADRALLSRLHDDGLDGTGEPLFQDLDALAELLAEAASTR